LLSYFMNMRGVFCDRRALSHHVEIMLSFVMFIGFVFFVLIFIRPYNNDFLTGSVVEGVHHNVFDFAETDLITFFVNASDSSDVLDCFRLTLPNELHDVSLNNSVFRKVGGSVADSRVLVHDVDVEGTEGFYYAFISDSLNEGGVDDECPNEFDYTFGSFYEGKVLSAKTLNEMKMEYINDYDALKQKVAVPDLYDFAIVSDFVSMEKEIPSSAEVFARDYVEKILFEDGRVEYVRFTVKVWR
jgi:hypothetical protein